MLDNVVSASTVQQSESAICIHILVFGLPSPLQIQYSFIQNTPCEAKGQECQDFKYKRYFIIVSSNSVLSCKIIICSKVKFENLHKFFKKWIPFILLKL